MCIMSGLLRNDCLRCIALGVLWITCSSPLHAQFLGHNITGDYGLQSATQPDPGTYLSLLYLGYRADSLRDGDGDPISYDPERRGTLDVNGYGLGVWWVSEKKVFGGNYSLMVAPAWTDNVLSAPVLGLTSTTDVGFTDLYVQPINLGWHTQRADYTAGIGVFAPTGSFDIEAEDNLGLGMWSLELFGGATVYFDKARTWHFAVTGFYETHSEKEGADIRVGDIATLEGGLGKSFMDGALSIGLAYYAQWKVTDDDFGDDFKLPDFLKPGKNRGFGLGPEVNIPLMSKKSLWGFLNLRYFWESGNRSTVQGDAFVATLTFPIPSVALQ